MEQRECSKCKVPKSLNDFYLDKRSPTGRRYDCKECHKTFGKNKYHQDEKYRQQHIAKRKNTARNRRKKHQLQLMQILAQSGCIACGERDPIVLDFDHIANKEFGISVALRRGIRWSAIVQELQKCQILCSNCHRRKTARELKHYECFSEKDWLELNYVAKTPNDRTYEEVIANIVEFNQ
jgi:5-methylcytosine-specific restriction endonuclease McrA